MITEKNHKKVIRTGEMKESHFGIEAKDTHVIMGILRDKMYTDKTRAILREYSTNATDAHVEAGIPDKPIRVTLPSSLDPNLKIRDFGFGLDEQGIRDTYCMYGKSTKRSTNDAIGQLGLGSKSGFSYSDSFIIVSYIDNLKYTYTAYIDETKIGSVALLSDPEPTDEPSGIEICIPIHQSDIRQMPAKAEEVFRYFRISPDVRGAKINLTRSDVVLEGDGWRITENGPGIAIMGDIGYPIDTKAILNLDQNLSIFSRGYFEINFNIGDLEIAASREGLEYNQKTSKAIQAKLREMLKEINKTLQEKISNCKDVWGAKEKYKSFSKGSYGYYDGSSYFRDALVKGINYKNILIKDDYIDYNNDHFTYNIFARGNSSTVTKRPRKSTGHYSKVQCLKETILVYDDNNSLKYLSRIGNHFDTNNDANYVYLLKGNLSKINQWMKDKNISKDRLIKLSSMDTRPVQPRKKNVKGQHKAFIIDVSSNIYRYAASDYWKETTIDRINGSGFYVPIYSYQIEMGNKEICPREMRKLNEYLKSFNITPPPFVGVKRGYVDKLGKNWKPYCEKINELLSKVDIKFVEEYDTLQSIPIISNAIGKRINEIKRKDSLLVKIYNLSKKKVSSSSNEKVRAMNSIKALGFSFPEPKKGSVVTETDLYKKYPMLNHLNISYVYDKQDIQDVIDYVNFVDKHS